MGTSIHGARSGGKAPQPHTPSFACPCPVLLQRPGHGNHSGALSLPAHFTPTPFWLQLKHKDVSHPGNCVSRAWLSNPAPTRLLARNGGFPSPRPLISIYNSARIDRRSRHLTGKGAQYGGMAVKISRDGKNSWANAAVASCASS